MAHQTPSLTNKDEVDLAKEVANLSINEVWQRRITIMFFLTLLFSMLTAK